MKNDPRLSLAIQNLMWGVGLPVSGALADRFGPVRVIAGAKDTIAGSPIPLAASIPGARAVLVPGKTHLTVIADGFFKGAVMGFLGHRGR